MARILMFCMVVAFPALAQAEAPTKLDPLLNMAVTAGPGISASLAKGLNFKAASDGAAVADVFIKTSNPIELAAVIEQWGGSIRTVAGSVVTASVPATFLHNLALLDIVTYVEAPKQVTAKLDSSRVVTKISDVQAGTGLSQAYTGSGVIVGIVDSGIDCQHADFQDSSGSTRMLAYWDQSISGSGVAEINNSSGREYTGSDLTGSACASSDDTDSGGHGTHVAGIATSKNGTYIGAAPDAKIVAVLDGATDADSAGTFSTYVVDAVNYIFRKAQSQSPKMPAVVNLSLGTSLGAHDDTSLFEQGLNASLQSNGSDKQGRAIVNAAGNENFSSADSEAATFGGIHATVDVTNTSKAFDFLIRSSSTVLDGYGGAMVDIWLSSGSDCTIQLDAYPKSSKTTATIDMSAVAKGSSSTASTYTDSKLNLALDFTDSNNANNGKQHAVASVTKVSGATANAATYSFDLVFIGTCSGDAWLYPDTTAYVSFRKVSALSASSNSRGYTYVDGDSNKTMTIPGTASKVITVGSFMGRATWTDINGNTHDQTSTSEGSGGTASNISLFSSLGPTASGSVKPDITAPGEPIISTTASTVSPSDSEKGDSTHHKMEGTSMASPHVTGTVALMLQRNGCLTPTEIKTLLKNNATTDTYTGSGSAVPNNTWGAGKLNALAAVSAVTAASCAPDNPSEDGAGDSQGGSTTTTTSSSGGGCSLIVR